MESFYKKEDKQLIFKMDEEIDECEVQKIRRKLDNEIERYMPKEIIFDFNNVSFMDSAGIGLIIGRYKLANMLGGQVLVTNMDVTVRKIFEMSGMSKIIPEARRTKTCPQIHEKKDRPQIHEKKDRPQIREKKDRPQIREKKDRPQIRKEVQYE